MIQVCQVMFSVNKEDLIEGARFESRQAFEQPKTLDNFEYLLRVICEELVVYEVWPVGTFASKPTTSPFV